MSVLKSLWREFIYVWPILAMCGILGLGLFYGCKIFVQDISGRDPAIKTKSVDEATRSGQMWLHNHNMSDATLTCYQDYNTFTCDVVAPGRLPFKLDCWKECHLP